MNQGTCERMSEARVNGPKILLAHTYYPEFLKGFYRGDPGLAALPFEEQRRRLLETRFSISDAYSEGLRAVGWEAHDIVINADPMQQRWADARNSTLPENLHERRRDILAAQVDELEPDVVYVFEWSPLGDTFLAELKSRVRLLVGQLASPLRGDRTYRAYDLMISSWPPIVDYFRKAGVPAEPLKLGFDPRVLGRLGDTSCQHAVTFVGGFAPSHVDRVEWLERVLKRVDVDVFGYGIETVPRHSPVREQHRGEVWGLDMYRVLAGSRVTLNRHAHVDVRGSASRRFVANMRLYEATGVGACLLTESRESLGELFAPGREVVAYADDGECVEQLRHLLNHEDERAAIARAGQARTLRDHTYTVRMAELSEILHRHL
jgi:hypothetical protein